MTLYIAAAFTKIDNEENSIFGCATMCMKGFVNLDDKQFDMSCTVFSNNIISLKQNIRS